MGCIPPITGVPTELTRLSVGFHIISAPLSIAKNEFSPNAIYKRAPVSRSIA